MKKITLLLLIVTSMVACESPKREWLSLKVIQDKPLLSVVNLRDTALDMGDGLAYEAVLRDTAGNEVGGLQGWLVTVDLSDTTRTDSSGVQKNSYKIQVDKIGTMVLNIGGDDIVVMGETSYEIGKQVMSNGQPQKRAILGGTGKYKGITGEILTMRNSDSTYAHELIYRLAD